MAKAAPSLPLLFLVLFLLSSSSGAIKKPVYAQKTWCVAKPSTDEKTLFNNLQYACSYVDCGLFTRPEGSCFNPNTTISHASVAMNLYYQFKGQNDWNCYFNNSGLVAITDPSYDNCVYAIRASDSVHAKISG